MQVSDPISVYFNVSPLTALEHEEWLSGKARGGDDEEEDAAPAPAAAAAAAAPASGGAGAGAAAGKGAAKGGKGAAAAPTITVYGRVVPATDSAAITAAVMEAMHGASNGGADATAAARTAAVDALQGAIASNCRMITETIRVPFLPDTTGVRPASAAVLGSDSDVVAGARLSLTITRASLWYPAPGSAAHEAVLAAVRSAAGDKPAQAVVDTALTAAACGDHDRTLRLLAANGGSILPARVDGVSVKLPHVYARPEALLAAADGAGAGLAAALKASPALGAHADKFVAALTA